MGRLTTRQLAGRKGQQDKSTKRAGLQPGDMLQNRYRIVGPLGSGGFSSVYQARDMRFTNATKLCAIKEMVISAPDPKMRQLTIKSFEREASMLAMLDHPAIPDVSDYFTEGDRSYLVLELIRGKDLEAWLEEEGEFLDQDTAIDWMIQLCDAASFLHNHKPQPIIFRDFKPSNIMLDQHNNIRLIDFNIAKVFEADIKGTMIGTEGYCPPEQYRGQSTPAGDIYALGATFHHILTKQDPRLEPPFTFAERPITAVNKKITPEFEAIIMRCLAYDPKDRFQSAEELKQALLALKNQPAGASTAVSDGQAFTPAAQPSGAPAVKTQTAETEIKPIWTFKCEDDIRSRPFVENGMVFIGAYDNNLYALDTNGEFLWKYPTTDGIGSSPCVYKDQVFIGSSDGHMYALELKNGRLNWRFKTEGPIYSSPSVELDHIFFGSDDGYLYALNIAKGRQVWKANAYSPVRSSPYVSVNTEQIFFGTEGSYVYCLQLSTGESKWQVQTRRAVTSSPAFADDIVFVGSLDGTVYALDATSGWTIWRFRTRRPVISSPAYANDAIYIGSSDGSLYAIDANSGRQIWQFETEGQVNSSPAVWNDAVYFGSTDKYVYCVNLKKGDLRWRFKTQGAVIGSPRIVDNVVYIGSTDNVLYALPA
jgi:outer membrane protein assembly factor BamB/tRNA A-37 threonylcarbamoyl transferase component Bud32